MIYLSREIIWKTRNANIASWTHDRRHNAFVYQHNNRLITAMLPEQASIPCGIRNSMKVHESSQMS
jgi:hypothetical protein